MMKTTANKRTRNTCDESSKQENESEEQESDSEQDEEFDDDDQEEEEFDQENESEDDEMKSDEEQGMDDTTDQFISNVTISCVFERRQKFPVTSSSRSSDLASKNSLIFQIFLKTDAEIVSPLDVHVQHVILELKHYYSIRPIYVIPESFIVFRFNDRITALEKEVVDLKKDPLHTQVTSLVDSHLDTRLGEPREEFMNFLSESLTARIKEQVKDQLPQILP
ncbi:hypothetical protein Tco_0099293 [Tanacetum coccineum]